MKRLTKVQREKLEKYILEAICNDGYYKEELQSNQDRINFLIDMFRKEYWNDYNKKYFNHNQLKAFEEFIKGRPSYFNIDFENYIILQVAERMELIKVNSTESKQDKFISEWFTLITYHTFNLHYKLNRKKSL